MHTIILQTTQISDWIQVLLVGFRVIFHWQHFFFQLNNELHLKTLNNTHICKAKKSSQRKGRLAISCHFVISLSVILFLLLIGSRKHMGGKKEVHLRNLGDSAQNSSPRVPDALQVALGYYFAGRSNLFFTRSISTTAPPPHRTLAEKTQQRLRHRLTAQLRKCLSTWRN